MNHPMPLYAARAYIKPDGYDLHITAPGYEHWGHAERGGSMFDLPTTARAIIAETLGTPDADICVKIDFGGSK